MSRRRSFSRVVGGGAIELAAVGLLVALVSSGRLHRVATESAELPEPAPIVAVSHPSTPSSGDDRPDEPSTLWSVLRQWRERTAASSEQSGTNPESREVAGEAAGPSWDEEFVEHQLVAAGEGLQKWLREQADEAIRSLWEK